MRPLALIKFLQIAAVMAIVISAISTAQADVLKFKVKDIDGKPAAGVKIFLYESTNVRKPADFISPQSDNNGLVIVTVPAGKYWAVARLKKDALYGPLMPGDKHSGEPVEVECSDTMDTEVVFEVADIREVGQKKRTDNAGTIRLWGRVVDKDGNPVAGAYVFASITKEIEYVPDFLSAWTDSEGNYTIYLPSGRSLFLGSARQFPPPAKLQNLRVLSPESAKLDIATDIQLIVH